MKRIPVPTELPTGKLCLSTHTLPNGLLVAAVENSSVPLVTIEIGVRNGSMNEPLPLNGLSHLYEHMFFKGNAAIPTQEAYMKRLRELGAVWNGTTGTERVDYFLTMATHNLESGMQFMSDAIKTPQFHPEELAKERQVVLGEFDRNEADPNYHLDHAVTEALFYRYPTYKDPLGNRDSIGQATVDQMLWMQKVYYVPNNSILVVAGDVKAEQVFELAEKYYGDWKRGPNPFVQYPLVDHPPLEKSTVLIVEQPVQTVRIALDWQGPDTEHDAPGTIAADVFSFAVNQDGSRLQKVLVDSGLAVGARLGYETLRNCGHISLDIETTPEKALDTITAALREARHFADSDYITAAGWQNSQRLLAVDDLFDRERVSSLTHTLTFWWSVAGLQDYLDYIPSVQAATRRDASVYASRYLTGRPSVLGVLVSPEDGQKFHINQASVEAILSQEWTSRPIEDPGTVAERSLSDEPGTGSADTTGSVTPWSEGHGPITLQVNTLPEVQSFQVDGLDVLLRHNPASPMVAVSAYFRGGSANLTPATQGIEQMALLTAARGGSQGMDRPEKSRRLDSMGTSVGISTSADYSRVDLACVKEFFAPSWTLFAESILHPAFAPVDVELFRRRHLSLIKTEKEQPEDEVRKMAEEMYYVNHPYALRPIGIQEVVADLTPAHLADYWKVLAQKSRMLLVVVGDVDRTQLEAALRGSLTHLPQGDYNPATVPPVQLQTGSVLVEPRKLPTTYVRGLYMAPAMRHADYPATRLATEILSDRLFEEVRTRRNLSYSVHCALSSRLTNYGVLAVTSTAPSEAVDVMMQQVARLAAEPLTADELNEQVQGFITHYFLNQETSRAQTEQLGHAQLIAGDWKEAYAFVDQVQRVTAAQVQEVAQKYFKDIQWAVLGNAKAVDKKVFGVP